MSHAILLISCPDQKGITATVTNFVYQNKGNIVHADQHIDEQSNTFFMRIEWELEGFSIEKQAIAEQFSAIAQQFSMQWNVYFTDILPRMALFVSRHTHCLYDVLLRYKAGQLACEIPLIVSNHADAEVIANEFGITFAEFPITQENKMDQEKQQINLLQKENIDGIILARYHQILTESFIQNYVDRIINIHHSFLPAFAGKSPYAQAYQKGVKIIGATSHYVTAQLDEGPIIAQDTVHISHRDSLQDLILKGEDLEKLVLNRALRLHLHHKILRYGNKTVVFD